MARTARLILVLALLAASLAAPQAQAQTAEGPAVADAAPAAAPAPQEPQLPAWPRPPDQPASLLVPAPPLGPPPPDLERPYFQPDPLLDPPFLGPLGWFADGDVGILLPHLVNQQTLPVTLNPGAPVVANIPGIPPGVTVSAPMAPPGPETFTVGVNAAPLRWTVSPRLEIGYRLPTGFGGFALSYRNLTAQGSQGVIGADGPGTLTSRLNANVADLDWVSNEWVPWQGWEMRVRVGLRYLNVYYDSQASEPFAEAAAGSTVFDQRTTNSTWVLGPHAGVDVRRRLGTSGLALTGFVNMSEGWGRVRQNYFVSTTLGPDGVPQTGAASISSSDAVPVLTVRGGLTWQPSASANIHLFAGYQLDYWWNIGRMGSFTEFGYFFDSGILLRGEWKF
jgi:hypothetical protein